MTLGEYLVEVRVGKEAVLSPFIISECWYYFSDYPSDSKACIRLADWVSACCYCIPRYPTELQSISLAEAGYTFIAFLVEVSILDWFTVYMCAHKMAMLTPY